MTPIVTNTLQLLPLLIVPTLLYFIFFQSRTGRNVSRTKRLIRLSIIMSVAPVVWGAYLVFAYGSFQSGLIGWKGLGFAVRVDALNMIIVGMINLIGAIVMTYSFNYLEGDRGHNRFLGNLAATIAAVQLFVLSGNFVLLFVAMVLTSIHLNQLLLFYKDRRRARAAARKKYILARVADVFMISAFTLLYLEYGTGSLEALFKSVQNASSVSSSTEVAMVLLAITAMFKSAQIPFHGWLVEVMEAPTPVSALLHAGLINAGPFLMLRFAHVLDATFYAPLVLFIIGGLSAIYGAMVFSTQSSVKTALGYSSVAHMGFTIMTCGLGVYPAALLHLTAHSFYKAHAFLSSGSLVDASRLYNLRTSFRKGSPLKIFGGVAFATGLFGTLVYFVNQQTTIPFQLEFIGYIIFLAIVTLLANAFDSRSTARSIFMVIGFAGLVILAFLSFEFMMESAIHAQLPGLKEVSTPMLYSGYALMVIFSAAILFTIISPLINKTEAYRAFGVHLRNGLYLNMYFDRLVGAHNVPKTKNRLK